MPSHDCPQRHGPVVPFVFIQPPHTGTGTIKGQLLADIPEFCRKQTGTATEQVILDMGIVPRKKGYAPKPPSRHTSFLLLQKEFGASQLTKIFTFGFVRSPFQRVLSSAAYLSADPSQQGADCSRIHSIHGRRKCARALFVRDRGGHINASALRRWIHDEQFDEHTAYLLTLERYFVTNGRLAVQWVGLVSQLSAGWADVCQRLNVTATSFVRDHCLSSCVPPTAPAVAPATRAAAESASANTATADADSWLDAFDVPSFHRVARRFANDLRLFAPLFERETWYAKAQRRFNWNPELGRNLSGARLQSIGPDGLLILQRQPLV